MKTLSLTLKFFAVTIFTLTLCTAAQAIPRTWVSSTGLDTNPCTRTAPCETFQKAHDVTDPGGEVNAVDSDNYGSVVIAKAITIDGGAGNVSSVDIIIGSAISITVAAADTVILRNISITGLGTGSTGIDILSSGQVVLENVTIERFTSRAVYARSLSAANPLYLEINNCRLKGNLTGLQQEDHTFVGIRDSIITGTLHKGQTSFGVNVQPAAGTKASLKLENNEISFTNSAIRATASDLGKGDVDLWVRLNHVFKNIVGANFSALVQYHSDGSNRLSDNQIPISGGTNAAFIGF